MAPRRPGDGRRAASRHHRESRANVSPLRLSLWDLSLSRRTFPSWDPIAFPRFYFLIIGVQVRIDLRGDPKESTVDRHFEDADSRRLSRISQQRRMQTRQIPAVRWPLHEFAESNLGSLAVAFREVIRDSLASRTFLFSGTRIFLPCLLQIDGSSIRGRPDGAKDICNGSWSTIVPSRVAHHASGRRLPRSRRHSYGDRVGTIHGPRLYFDRHASRYITF